MLLDDYIACKGILLLHLLLFCVEKDFLLWWLDDHNVSIGIWLLHVLLFCVDQDYPLKSLDKCVSCKGI